MHLILISYELCTYFMTDCLYGFSTGPILGLMHPNRNKTGLPMVEMELRVGATVEMVQEEEPATTGGSPTKVPAQWAGIATVTGLALDVGASKAEPTQAAATPGWGVEDQIPLIRARQIKDPHGASRSTNPILRVTVRVGVSQ